MRWDWLNVQGQLPGHLFCVCLCAVLYQLWPKNLVCPGASNWGKWNSGAVNRQTECLSPAARRIHSADIYITYTHTYFPQTDLQPNQARQKLDENISTACVCVRTECVNVGQVSIHIYIRVHCIVHFCREDLLAIHVQPCYWLNWGQGA